MNQRYILTIAYNGTSFGGWQTQHRNNSVQEILQSSFFDVFKMPIRLIAASRTDVGVHAFGQIVLGLTNLVIAPERLLKAWNDGLPSSIYIRFLKKDDTLFHPWYNVLEKKYYYHLVNTKLLPWVSPFVWQIQGNVDWAIVKDCLQLFSGTHDFFAFKHSEDMRENSVRTVKKIDLRYLKGSGFWRITVIGNSFLRHMIRKIVGAAIFIGMKDRNNQKEVVALMLATKQILLQIPTAPPQGLILQSITYVNKRDII